MDESFGFTLSEDTSKRQILMRASDKKKKFNVIIRSKETLANLNVINKLAGLCSQDYLQI